MIKAPFTKAIHIMYLSVLYFLAAYVSAVGLDIAFDKFLPVNHDKVKTFFELILEIAVVGIACYLARNIVKKIPFPLHYAEDDKVSEIYGGALMSTLLILLLRNFTHKIDFLRDI